MSTPSLSMLMRARKAGITAEDMTPEELAQAEAAMLARRQAPTGPRGQAPAGQTASPDVFASPDTAGLAQQNGVYASDPSAVGAVREENSPQYLATLQKQIEGLAAQVPGWRGQPMRFFEGTMVDPGGTAIDLRDEKQVAPYISQLMNEVRPPAAEPPPDVLQGLILKSTESDPASSTFLPFPKDLAEKYGLLGVDSANLSVGEKILLRRMGVVLPTPKRRRR